MAAAMSLSGEEQTAQPNVFTPAKLGPVMLRNRIIKAATFEASTPNALVTDDLITYHRLPAAGGVAMTTVAYLAVSPGGRTEGRQIWWRPEAVPGLKKLTAAIHAEGAAVSAQIGHAGPVADAHQVVTVAEHDPGDVRVAVAGGVQGDQGVEQLGPAGDRGEDPAA